MIICEGHESRSIKDSFNHTSFTCKMGIRKF
jgi:hypothetical protein